MDTKGNSFGVVQKYSASTELAKEPLSNGITEFKTQGKLSKWTKTTFIYSKVQAKHVKTYMNSLNL